LQLLEFCWVLDVGACGHVVPLSLICKPVCNANQFLSIPWFANP
jgi:ABC-type uncharacterized transport system permease subunit